MRSGLEEELVGLVQKYEHLKDRHEEAYNSSGGDENDNDRLGVLSFEDGIQLDEDVQDAIRAAFKPPTPVKIDVEKVEDCLDAYENFLRKFHGEDLVDKWLDELYG